MKIFKLDDVYSVICKYENTRNGFRHLAFLMKNDREIAKNKCLYCNRTWEAYEYETVLKNLINGYFENKEKEKFLNAIKWENLKNR